MKSLFFITLTIFSLLSVKTPYQRLTTWMEGSFSSELQSKNDSGYFDMRLHMKRIWLERSDGVWLYVEQAMGNQQNKPNRQLVYCISQVSDSLFENRVYTLQKPIRFVGAWNNPALFNKLIPDSLTLRKGCSILFTPRGDSAFVGSTQGQECSDEIRGAAYVTSTVKITESELIIWDRGFGNDGKQMRGAEKGGYIFKKIQSSK